MFKKEEFGQEHVQRDEGGEAGSSFYKGRLHQPVC